MMNTIQNTNLVQIFLVALICLKLSANYKVENNNPSLKTVKKVEVIEIRDFKIVKSSKFDKWVDEYSKQLDLLKHSEAKDYVVNVLVKEGLPKELKHLPMIESNYQPKARSGAGAVGIWQLTKQTAKHLKLNPDHRNDIVKSTQAATVYLAQLNERFGTWPLALAAYNVGPTKLAKLLKKHNAKTFVEVEKFLPKETRNYVAKFFALAYLDRR